MSHAVAQDKVLADTRRWLERAVIGLNLCPFAKAVYVKDQVRLIACESADRAGVLEALRAELQLLAAADPARIDTTLLVLPAGFDDFIDFNALTTDADRLVRRLRLDGVLQVASFHPRFQFAGTSEDDVTNCTNRSPYPTLHLLREASIDRAVAAFPDAAEIYEENKATLRRLGPAGWAALGVGSKS